MSKNNPSKDQSLNLSGASLSINMLGKKQQLEVSKKEGNYILKIASQNLACKAECPPQLIQQEPSSIMLSDQMIVIKQGQNINKSQNLLSENLAQNQFDIENLHNESSKLETLYQLIRDMISRPYPSEQQCQFVKQLLMSYRSDRDQLDGDIMLNNLSNYFDQRNSQYPECLLKSFVYKQSNQIMKFFLGFLNVFLKQSIIYSKILIIQSMLIQWISKYQETDEPQVNRQICGCFLKKITQYCSTNWETIRKPLSASEKSLVDAISKSDIINNYIYQFQSLQSSQIYFKQIEQSLENAFKYLLNNDLEYGQMPDGTAAYIDLNGQVIFSKGDDIHQLLFLFIKIWSYYLSNLKLGLVISSHNDVELQFQQEMFPFPIDPFWLSDKRAKYISNPSNWSKSKLQFQQDLDQIDNTSLITAPSIEEELQYNPLQDSIILEIRELFAILSTRNPTIQQNRIIQEINTDTTLKKLPLMNKFYTPTEYFMTLLMLVKKVFHNKQYLKKLKAFSHKHPQVLAKNFELFLQTRSVPKRMLLESYYIWIFQKTRFSSDMTHDIEIILNQQVKFIRISKQDTSLLEVITKSQRFINSMHEISKIYKNTQPRNLKKECEELIQFVSVSQVIEFNVSSTLGITLLNARIGLNISLNPKNQELSVDALRIVTLIHELFGHKDRLEYVNFDNVLKQTPKKNEAGQLLETGVFGCVCSEFTETQAQYILNAAKWQLPKKNFISEFSILSGSQPNKVPKGHQKKNTMKYLMGSEDQAVEEKYPHGKCFFERALRFRIKK